LGARCALPRHVLGVTGMAGTVDVGVVPGVRLVLAGDDGSALPCRRQNQPIGACAFGGRAPGAPPRRIPAANAHPPITKGG
jgi:hypothetical protein